MKNFIESIFLNIKIIVAIIMDSLGLEMKTYAGGITTTELVNRIYNFCEVYSGRVMYPYQGQFSKRIIRSVLENDGAELTALFSRQSGKCFAKNTEILMYDGSLKKVQDIKVGDYVMTPNSKGARVTALGRGREEMFEIRPKDFGYKSFVVNKSHILSLRDDKGTVRNISVEDYIRQPLKNYKGYRVSVDYPAKSVSIYPYFFGRFLTRHIRIPISYLRNCRQVRLRLLKGIVDSDLCRIFKKDFLGLSFKKELLAKDTLELLRSLGFKTSIEKIIVEKNGKQFRIFELKSFGDFSYILDKQEEKYNEGVRVSTFDFDLIPKGIDDYYGFTIDSDDRLFLLGDYTVTHNTETVAITVGGLMIILPQLANMPMFLNDRRLKMFRDGLWVGIFAPSQRQAQTTYGRMKSRMQCKEAQAVLNDPDFRLVFTTSNGQTVALSNGSFCTAISASDGSNIEGESFKFIILEECQDISNFKIRKCLTGDTKVLTSTGEYKRIDEVVKDKNDLLYCLGDNFNTFMYKKPFEFYDNGVQDVYKVTLENGYSVKCTLNHKFPSYYRGEKVRFKDRTLEDIVKTLDKDRPTRIALLDSIPIFGEEGTNDYEKGLLIGYFLGDGCLRNVVNICKDVKTVERVKSLIKLLGFDFTFNENVQGPVVSTFFRRCPELITFFKEYELLGKKGADKKLQNKIYSKEFYKGLVEALIETDGCVESYITKPVISFSNISKDLVYQLRDILLKYGIHCTIFEKSISKGFGSNNTLYNLQIKGVIDLRRFYQSFRLYNKQWKLEKAIETLEDKVCREQSKYYPSTLRFYKIRSVEYVGKEHTYCVNMDEDEKGIHNIVVNGGISTSQSVHPMGAAYNATICKIGTATTFKGDFYEAIQRNKQFIKDNPTLVRNHFEYDCDVVARFNPKYAKYLEREKRSLGENSDEYRMSYKLEWIISRGMFVDIQKVEKECGDEYLGRVPRDMQATHVVGIDVGGGSSSNKKYADSTVITVVEVNWNEPVLMEKTTDDETGEDIVYTAYNTYIKDWCEIRPEIAENYEEQYQMIMEYLKNFNVVRIVIDATRESSLAQRIQANMRCEVIPFVFSSKSKSDIYKHLQIEINTGRARFPRDRDTIVTSEYRKFTQQLADLQKGYSGSHLVVSHPDEKGAHDDYPDSWCLAVWGTRDQGYVDNTETLNRGEVLSVHKNTSVFGSKNRFTARRR